MMQFCSQGVQSAFLFCFILRRALLVFVVLRFQYNGSSCRVLFLSLTGFSLRSFNLWFLFIIFVQIFLVILWIVSCSKGVYLIISFYIFQLFFYIYYLFFSLVGILVSFLLFLSFSDFFFRYICSVIYSIHLPHYLFQLLHLVYQVFPLGSFLVIL